MKITLTLTKQEIVKLIGEHLNIKIDELRIVNEKSKIIEKSKYELALREAIRMFPDRMTQKISAIKHFRELLQDKDNQATIGLVEAKYAVENVENAIQQYNNTGKIPYGF